MACRDGRDDIVELLLIAGANPNTIVSADSKYFPGTSPLDIANQKGHHNIVRKLIQSSANFSSQSNEASSPFISSDSIKPKSSSWFDRSGVLSFSFFGWTQDRGSSKESEVNLDDPDHTITN